MKNPFRKNRAKGDRTHAEQVTLTTWNDKEIQSFTPISQPDALTPVGHSLPRTDPHTTDLRQTISDKVQALAREGSLDEFTFDVLDEWIDTWHETWVAAVVQHAEERRRVAARLFATHRQNLVTEKEELAEWLERKRELDSVYVELRREAGLADPDAAPAEPTAAEHPADAELDDLLAAATSIRQQEKAAVDDDSADLPAPSTRQLGTSHGGLRPVEGESAANE